MLKYQGHIRLEHFIAIMLTRTSSEQFERQPLETAKLSKCIFNEKQAKFKPFPPLTRGPWVLPEDSGAVMLLS